MKKEIRERCRRIGKKCAAKSRRKKRGGRSIINPQNNDTWVCAKQLAQGIRKTFVIFEDLHSDSGKRGKRHHIDLAGDEDDGRVQIKEMKR